MVPTSERRPAIIDGRATKTEYTNGKDADDDDDDGVASCVDRRSLLRK